MFFGRLRHDLGIHLLDRRADAGWDLTHVPAGHSQRRMSQLRLGVLSPDFSPKYGKKPFFVA